MSNRLSISKTIKTILWVCGLLFVLGRGVWATDYYAGTAIDTPSIEVPETPVRWDAGSSHGLSCSQVSDTDVEVISCVEMPAVNDPVNYWWECSSGSFVGGSTGQNVTYQCPSTPGEVTVTVYVGDDEEPEYYDDGDQSASLTIGIFDVCIKDSDGVSDPETWVTVGNGRGYKAVVDGPAREYSPDKYVKTYQWSVTQGAELVTLTNDTSSTVTVTAGNSPGSVTLQVIVSVDGEELDPVTHNLEVKPYYEGTPIDDIEIIVPDTDGIRWGVGTSHTLEASPAAVCDCDQDYEGTWYQDACTIWWTATEGSFSGDDNVGYEVTYICPEDGHNVTVTVHADDDYNGDSYYYNDAEKTDERDIVAVEVDRIEVDDEDITDEYYFTGDGDLTLTAVPDPSGGWPTGEPDWYLWDGDEYVYMYTGEDWEHEFSVGGPHGVKVDCGTDYETTDVIVIDVTLSTPSAMVVNDTQVLTCNAVPDPSDISDMVDACLYWSFIEGSDPAPQVTFEPSSSSESETTVMTATAAGTGFVEVWYYAGDAWVSDSKPVTISGVGIYEPAVGIVDEAVEFTASGYPSGSTYTWSIANGTDPDADADGYFVGSGTTGNTVSFTGTIPGTGFVKVEYGTADDTAPLVVLDVNIASGNQSLEIGDTVELSCNAVPDPWDIDGVLIWNVDNDESTKKADGYFDPNGTSRYETTIFTATEAGTGLIALTYWYGGEYAEDTIELKIAGATIDDAPLVFVKDESESVSATAEPDGSSSEWYEWTLLDSDGNGDGIFDPDDGDEDTANPTTFDPTTAGTGIVQVEYWYDEVGPYTDTANMVILDVNPTPTTLLLEVGDTVVVDAHAVPNPTDVNGTLEWYMDWKSVPEGSAKVVPGYSYDQETTIFTAVSFGTGNLMVEYALDNKIAYGTVPVTIGGVEIVAPGAIDLGVSDTTNLDCTALPSGGTFSWSLVDAGTPAAGGTFTQNTDEDPTFTGTTAGTAMAKVQYSVSGKTYSDSIPCTVREVEVTQSVSVIPINDEATLFICNETPPYETSDGALKWSVIGGDAEILFTPDNDTTVCAAARQAGTTLVQVKYEGVGDTQGYDTDQFECTVIQVDIDSAPAWIALSDTTTLHALPTPDTSVTSGTLKWRLLDVDADMADVTTGGMFNPNDSAAAETTIFTATGVGTGNHMLVVDYTVSGVTTSDSHLVKIFGDLNIIPGIAFLCPGDTCLFQAMGSSGIPYDTTEVTWTVITESGYGAGSISVAGLCDEALYTSTAAGTCLVQCALNADSCIKDTAEPWAADLDLEGAHAYGPAVHQAEVVDLPPLKVNDVWVKDYCIFPASGKVDANEYALFAFLKVTWDGNHPLPQEVFVENATRFDVEYFVQYIATLSPFWQRILNFLGITAQTLFDWTCSSYNLTSAEKALAEQGYYWISPVYTEPGWQDTLRLARVGVSKRPVEVRPYVATIDLSVDSNNDGRLDDADDDIEDIAGDSDYPGMILGVNDGDSDDDVIPNFADGFDWDDENANDDTSLDGGFGRITIELPDSMDIDAMKLKITYENDQASDPADVTYGGTPPAYAPGSGSLRIWTEPEDVARHKESVTTLVAEEPEEYGDYVPPGIYTPAELGFTNEDRIKEFYVEGVAPSTGVADKRIKIELDPDGNGPIGFIANDAARFTIVAVDIDVYRLGASVPVPDQKEVCEGSVARVLNPYLGEEYGTWKVDGIKLRLALSGIPLLEDITYKLSLEEHIADSGLDLPVLQVSDGALGLIDTYLYKEDETELSLQLLNDNFWVEFYSADTTKIKLEAFLPNGMKIHEDMVTVSGIVCDPMDGAIHFVSPPATQSYVYNTIVDALSAAGSEDNVIVADDFYTESRTSTNAIRIDKSIVLAGLGGCFWKEYFPADVHGRFSEELAPFEFSSTSMHGPVLSGNNTRCVIEITNPTSDPSMNVSIAGLTVTEGESGGIVCANVNTLRLIAVALTDSFGGGLHFDYTSDGTLEIRDCLVEGNQGAYAAGGIDVNGDVDVTVLRTRFHENFVHFTNDAISWLARAGAFDASYLDGSVTIEKSIFWDNYVWDDSDEADNTYVEGAYGGACGFLETKADITIKQTDFTENKTLSKANRAVGGAIAFKSVSNEESIIENCRFHGNYAYGGTRAGGGAVYLRDSDVSISQDEDSGWSKFRENYDWTVSTTTNLPAPVPQFEAPEGEPSNQSLGHSHIPDYTSYGGAIAVHDEGHLVVTDIRFERNKSKHCGGAIGFSSVTEAITGETCMMHDDKGPVIYLEDDTFEENKSVEFCGGAIVGAGRESSGIISGSLFILNKSRPTTDGYSRIDGDGGAVAFQASSKNLYFAGTKFEHNLSNGGGGACKVGGMAWMTLSDCDFVYNRSDACGGAVRVSTGGTLRLHRGTIDKNFASLDSKGEESTEKIVGHGGAISMDNAIVTIDSTLIQNCSAGSKDVARHGGAFHMESSSKGVVATASYCILEYNGDFNSLWMAIEKAMPIVKHCELSVAQATLRDNSATAGSSHTLYAISYQNDPLKILTPAPLRAEFESCSANSVHYKSATSLKAVLIKPGTAASVSCKNLASVP